MNGGGFHRLPVKTAPWEWEFEIMMSLSKEHPGLRGKKHQGGRHTPENVKPGDEGHHPPNRRTRKETNQVYPDVAANPEYKVHNYESSFSNTRFLFSGNLRLYRREKNQQGRREDQSSNIHLDPTNRDNSYFLQTHA